VERGGEASAGASQRPCAVTGAGASELNIWSSSCVPRGRFAAADGVVVVEGGGKLPGPELRAGREGEACCWWLCGWGPMLNGGGGGGGPGPYM
jgi:hypothetical protein